MPAGALLRAAPVQGRLGLRAGVEFLWSRPGLDVRTRRLLVLAITAALGRWEEFRLHLRAGLAHGLEPCDVKEALLQTAIYAGAPAANTAFQIAVEEQECARKSG